MSLYLALNIGSILVPFIFSFHPRIRFNQHFGPAFMGIAISGAVYLAWDIPFTMLGYWGFSEEYLAGLYLIGLPIEEWLFFICIPFACLFTWYTIKRNVPLYRIGRKMVKYISYGLIALLFIVAVLNFNRAYTALNGLLCAIIVFYVHLKNPRMLESFYPVFIIILIPFFLVNGVLTGSFIDGEVVWYNNEQNLGIRLFTIPIEDTFYALGMILLSSHIMDITIQKKAAKESKP